MLETDRKQAAGRRIKLIEPKSIFKLRYVSIIKHRQ